MKIWRCGRSPRSGSRNAWTRIKNVNGSCPLSDIWNFFVRRDPNDFLSRLVTMDETRLYHYDPKTKKQSVKWQHSGLTCPKIFRVQKSDGKFLASTFWDQDGIILIDYLPKSQTINVEYYYLCWCNWRTFWRKCIELRGECVEYIPNLVAVACFLPDWAKGLSAPPRRNKNRWSLI